MSSIPHLPTELLSLIVSRLPDSEDRKNFRLICRVCEPVPLPFLFRRICLSRLKWDKDVFEQIASHPHLAQYVRELVWYELQLETWIDRNPMLKALEEDGYEAIRQLLVDATYDHELFWFPRVDDSSNQVDEQRIIEDYRPQFFHLLEKMSGLKTFASCPMPGDREILYNDYLITVDLFLLQLDSELIGYSWGFLNFLMPAMERPASTVIDLRLAEKRTYISLLFLPTSLTLNANAFRTLTSIDLCLNCTLETSSNITEQTVKDNTNAVAACLRSANGLRHLALRLNEPANRRLGVNGSLSCYSDIILDDLIRESYWPQLTSVHLQNVPSFCKGCFPKFLGKHAATLQSLSLEGCRVMSRDLLKLRSLDLLQLSSLEITSDCLDDQVHEEEAEEEEEEEKEPGLLLAYLNHTSALYETQCGDISVVGSGKAEFVTCGGKVEEEKYEKMRNPEIQTYTFTNGDGRMGVGSEPLEYFSDWDTDDDENIAEPCETEPEPYGRQGIILYH